MAAPQTVESFIQLCRKSGVVEMPQLEQFVATNPLPDDPKQAAALLVQKGILTRFQAAQLLHGKYRGFVLNGLKILEQLGIGGMGAVYLCEQVMLRRKVAVKVLPTKQALDRVARERFFREARAVAALDHPNIIRIHDCASTNDIHYILMEYIEGLDLQARMEKTGPLPVEEAIGYIIQAASGLQHAHERGLVHRDIKPSNLLVDPSGVVKILDMGLARFFQDSKDNLTQQLDGGAIVGTVDFLAPEQAMESSSVDSRADIYSLGATLYTLLNGKPPFGGTTTQKLMNHQVMTPPPLNEVRLDVPPELNTIVQKMMAKSPDQRYQTAQEVIEALAAWAPAPTIKSNVTTVSAPRSNVIPRSMSEMINKSPAPSLSPATAKLAEPSAGKKPWQNPKVLIGAGVGLVLLVGLILALSGGGGEKPNLPVIPKNDQTQAKGEPKVPEPEKKEEPKTPPPKQKEPEPKQKTVEPKVPLPVAGKVLAAFPSKDVAPVTFKYRGYEKLETRGTGQLPAGWRTASWEKNSVVETSVEMIDGLPAVVQKNLEGKASNMIFTPTFPVGPESRYEVQINYRTTGESRGSLVFYEDQLKNRTLAELPATKGAWRTRTVNVQGVTAPGSGRFELHFGTIGADHSIAYRNVQIRELPLRSEKLPVSVYQIDFGSLAKFSVQCEYSKIISSTGAGKWPGGWGGSCWKAGSKGEGAVEEFGGRSLLALRTLEGDPSMQFFSDRAFENLQPGKQYRVRFTYLAEARCTAEFQLRYKVQPPVAPHFNGVPLRNTDGLLRTLEVDFSPLPNLTYGAWFQNQSKGEKSTLFLKDLQVFEVTPNPVGESLIRLDSGGLKTFKLSVRGEEEMFREGVGNLPPDWKAINTRPQAMGNVSVELNGLRPAIALETVEGEPSLHLMTTSPVATVRAGHTYQLWVVYSTKENRRCTVAVTNEGQTPIERLYLLPTQDQWRESSLRFVAKIDQPVNLILNNLGKPEDGKILIRTLELIDVTANQ
jgi:serine/threonine protein kinase